MEPLEEVEFAHSLENLARLVWTYYQALLAEGFEPTEALRLTVAWQEVMLARQGDG